MSDFQENIIIEKSELEALISAHDGTVTQLYVWSLINEARDYDAAARALCLTLNDVKSGFEKLDRLITFTKQSVIVSTTGKTEAPSDSKPVFLPKKEELPNYTSTDITSRLESSDFKAVVEEAQSIFGRGLNSAELSKLFGIYDYLQLPAEVIFMLLNYCSEEAELKRGAGHKPTIRFIEQEAFYWANNGLNTLESVDSYIKHKRDSRQLTLRVYELFGIKNREPGKSEAAIINRWIELGYDYDCIYEAYDRTVLKIHEPNLRYIDSIINGWHEKKLHSISDIRSNAPLVTSSAKVSHVKQENKSGDYEAAKRFLEKTGKRK